jgi:hypothetical protein
MNHRKIYFILFFLQGLFRHTTCADVYDNQFNRDKLCYGNVLFNT